MLKLILRSIIFIYLSGARADQFSDQYICLTKCLEKIESYRYFYDVALFSIHNNIQARLEAEGLSLKQHKVEDENRHRVVDYILKDEDSAQLVHAKKKLESVYKSLFEDCQKKINKKNSGTIDLALPTRRLIDGSQRFDILSILTSPDYRFKLENSLSKGFGIGINEIEYDPANLSFKILVGKNGEILFNGATVSSIKEKLRIKMVAGEKLSDTEKFKLKRANMPAHFIYIGTINVVDLNTSCQKIPRGDLDENYCVKGLKTFWRRVIVSTGEVVNVSASEAIHPFFISDDLQGDTPEHTSRGNLSQINSTLKLIENSVCINRNEIFNLVNSQSGFNFKLPCPGNVLFPLPAPISKY